MALLDQGDAAPPVLVERLEDGALQVTEDAEPVAATARARTSRRTRSGRCAPCRPRR